MLGLQACAIKPHFWAGGWSRNWSYYIVQTGLGFSTLKRLNSKLSWGYRHVLQGLTVRDFFFQYWELKPGRARAFITSSSDLQPFLSVLEMKSCYVLTLTRLGLYFWFSHLSPEAVRRTPSFLPSVALLCFSFFARDWTWIPALFQFFEPGSC